MYIQFVVFPTWSNDFRYMYIFPCAYIIFLHPLLSGLWSSCFICYLYLLLYMYIGVQPVSISHDGRVI